MSGNHSVVEIILSSARSMHTRLVFAVFCACLIPACAGAPALPSAPAAAGLQHLPPPSVLAEQTSPAKTGSAVLQLNGAEYDPALPNNLVVIEGTALWFHSNWTSVGKPFTDLAYATYVFHPEVQTGGFSITTNWNNPPDDGQFWIGLADNALDKWHWFLGSHEQPLALDDLSVYLNPQGQLIVVVAMMNLPLAPPPPDPLLSTISIQVGP